MSLLSHVLKQYSPAFTIMHAEDENGFLRNGLISAMQSRAFSDCRQLRIPPKEELSLHIPPQRLPLPRLLPSVTHRECSHFSQPEISLSPFHNSHCKLGSPKLASKPANLEIYRATCHLLQLLGNIVGLIRKEKSPHCPTHILMS